MHPLASPLTLNPTPRNQKIHFLETLHALCSRVAACDLPYDEEYTIHDKLVARLPKDKVPPKYTVAGVGEGSNWVAVSSCPHEGSDQISD